MKPGTKFTWGFILAFGGMVLFVIGIALSFTLIGACIGLPMAVVGFPLIIWGSVWLFKARAEKAREIIARGIQEGLARFDLPTSVAIAPKDIPASGPISLPPAPPLPRVSVPDLETLRTATPISRNDATARLPHRPERAPREWPKRLAAAIAAFAENVKDGLTVIIDYFSQRKSAPVALALALIVMTFIATALGILLYQRSAERPNQVTAFQEDKTPRREESAKPKLARDLSTPADTRSSVAIQTKPPGPEALKTDFRAEAITQAETLWKQAWIPLGDTWIARAEMSPYLVQIRNRRVQAEPRALNEADRLNGVEWEGTVAFYRSAERRFAFESSAGGVRMDPYNVGWNEWRSPDAGAVAVYRLKRQNGRWSRLENDLASAAKMEWGRDEMVRPKTSELRLAGINVEGASNAPLSPPMPSTKIAAAAAVTPATSPAAATLAKEPPGFTDHDGEDATAQPSPAVTQWPGEQFPETRARTLSPGELQPWSQDRLQYAINEMFARRGADFGDKRVSEWFRQFKWYRPIPNLTFDQIETGMPEVERANLKLLGDVRDTRRSTVTAPSSSQINARPRPNPNFPPDPIGQTIARFFQALGDNAHNTKAAAHRSPTPSNRRKR